MSTPSFAFPPYYQLPPFFTLQRFEETLSKQLQMWELLIISYCKSHHMSHIDLRTADEMELFHNKTIKRQLSFSDLQKIIDYLVSKGHASWDDEEKTQALIMWKTKEEWISYISKWVSDNGQKGTAHTLHAFVTEGEPGVEDLIGLDEKILASVFEAMQDQGLCVMKKDRQGKIGVLFK
ncbi:Vacuolar protein sorting 25B (Vps25B) [Monocercomonoides exilis]|uniref:Vacuolar protein sorting 25B (Vps25B) n=1 Tax=Monocercomonoides exilis TaxID=2049356 RepID=UPI00355A91D3|nr:Vacuolar protein sorting 25B (Vps25B) [Monocercomonoides exilis]|eukprot:MONOS_16847.1-p1 / transcript=MONOS_16847.1 / gene=MONOS_16847 / organism=Monocercomonoides_exilis_PA203 / gene_product= Vacuolar protein sorting 25B (Vps25B) / transcript_product= Vacuolar protein sorting 25B (Vps25B) / location=Mono_scaffold00422:48190-48979(-) / protein_length=179 / sequence_SO=supercontig / SO=protein_coding / is_pseudo=false